MQMLIANQTAAFRNNFTVFHCENVKGSIILVSHQITQATVISLKNLISPKCFDSNFGEQVVRRGTGIF